MRTSLLPTLSWLSLLPVLLGGGCGGGGDDEPTRAVLRLELGDGVTAADVARVESVVEGNPADPEGRARWATPPESTERREERPAEGDWPLRLVVEPRDGDASRWFLVRFRVFRAESDAEPSWTLRLVGGFQAGRTTEYVLRIEAACDGVACPDDPASSCEAGACVSAWKVPGVGPAPADGGPDGATSCMDDTDCDDGSPCTMDACGEDGTCEHVPQEGARCTLADGGEGVCDAGGACVGCRSDEDCDETHYCDETRGVCTRDCVADVAAGDHHSCAVTEDGRVFCWGSNGYGQLGIGTTDDRLAPVPVASGLPPVARLALGNRHSCALTRGEPAAVYCWGGNGVGQLGIGLLAGIAMRSSPMPIEWPSSPAPHVVGLASGAEHLCAVTDDQQIFCWGGNDNRQTDPRSGDGAAGRPRIRIMAGAGFVGAGGDTSCAVAGGELGCWGASDHGQAGVVSTAPVTTQTLRTGVSAKQLSLGHQHGCVLQADGSLLCWGRNDDGQLGRGHTMSPQPSAGAPATEDTFVEVAAGGYHTCAIREGDRKLLCWGDGEWSATGLGGPGDTTTPTEVPGLSKPVAHVAAGLFHTCAVDLAGRLFCWGRNDNGRSGAARLAGWLGTGDTDPRPSPTRIAADFCADGDG